MLEFPLKIIIKKSLRIATRQQKTIPPKTLRSTKQTFETFQEIPSPVSRKLQLQLLIALGNAELTDQQLPEAAAAACEAMGRWNLLKFNSEKGI